jgi:hypothetical protein
MVETLGFGVLVLVQESPRSGSRTPIHGKAWIWIRNTWY